MNYMSLLPKELLLLKARIGFFDKNRLFNENLIVSI